jgi:hypothetical protein
MVAGLFSAVAYTVDEGQRGNEIFKFEGSRQLPGFDLPAGKGTETVVSIFL